MEDHQLLLQTAENPPDNIILIIGGNKIKESIEIISRFLEKSRVSKILVGGCPAYTFLKAGGTGVGESPVEEDYLKKCRDIMKSAKKKKVEFLLPIDHIAAIKCEPDITIKITAKEESIPDNMKGLDIGFETAMLFADALQRAGLIIWYGPLGVHEIETFSAGTIEIARAAVRSGAPSIILGESLAAGVKKAGVADQVSYLSADAATALATLVPR